MPVDRASYRGWAGTVQPSHRVIFAIAGTMIRRSMKQRLVRMLVWIVVLAVCLISAGWFYAANSGAIDFIRRLEQQLPGLNLLALANRILLSPLNGIGMLMAAIVGTPLIAEDQKARALPLYFSRPISHLDYVLGKFLTISWFLGLIYLMPPLVMYIIQLGFTDEAGLAAAQLPVLLKAFIPGAVGCAVYASLALGVSSLTEKTSQAALLYFGLVMMAGALGAIFSIEIFQDPNWQAVSPGNCIQRISAAVFPMPPQVQVMTGRAQEMSATAAWIGAGAWTAAGLAVLTFRVRKVEVVS